MLSIYDLKSFYASPAGGVVRDIIAETVATYWQKTKGLEIAGCGYSLPYLDGFDDAARVIAVCPAALGAHHWPDVPDARNKAVLSEDTELPFQNASIDRILIVHSLEFTELADQALEEIWRVLKPQGRAIIVVPNRSGLWAHDEKKPFGQGRPFSFSQIESLLRANRFTIENAAKALYIPPSQSPLLLKTYKLWEVFGRYMAVIPAGLRILEVSKQLYRPVQKGTGSRVRIRGRGFMGAPKPVANSRASE